MISNNQSLLFMSLYCESKTDVGHFCVVTVVLRPSLLHANLITWYNNWYRQTIINNLPTDQLFIIMTPRVVISKRISIKQYDIYWSFFYQEV